MLAAGKQNFGKFTRNLRESFNNPVLDYRGAYYVPCSADCWNLNNSQSSYGAESWYLYSLGRDAM
jgi:hypothetical protein